MLDQHTVAAYIVDLRERSDAVLYRIERLQAAATECGRLSHELLDSSTPSTWSERVRQNTHIIDELESLLAAWARLSLLFFPASRTKFATARGEELVRIFRIPSTSLLANRDLR